jgi:2-polyprenyl-3-methyl-5-hydroxy-6-metoxy-1,4-benzoquinol methylase
MPEQVKTCILCGEMPERFAGFAVVRGWHYVRCTNCGLVFLNPQPTEAELNQFYNHSYRYDVRRYEESISSQGVWLDMLEQLCGLAGNMLEVGCSYGYFLSAARKRGWSVQGVELGAEAVAHAQKTLGLPVKNGRISDMRNGRVPSFDAVVAWHVLEHDPLPLDFAKTAFECLRPGGILAFRVPNLESTVAKLAGPCWQWLSPPEHVCMYTRETLSRLLAKCNFEIISWQTARGNARNMWFEILRARTKQMIRRQQPQYTAAGPDSLFEPATEFQNRVWYRAAEKLVAFGTLPLDLLFTPSMVKRDREAELAVFARKPKSEFVDGRTGPIQ